MNRAGRNLFTAPKAYLARKFSVQPAVGGKQFKPKSFYEASVADAGVYPVVVIIVGALAFVVVTIGYQLSLPDSRIFKSSRKNPLRGIEYER
mmetsp:Transcript_108/g.101  ORF Transcript_108/g.101 Transcript_108/m.101 type:complete len:92 (+) Transcript_108:96-371(+)